MEKLIIEGGVPLKGSIRIGGAKNAALPLMTAALLSEETLTLSNLPHLADIISLVRVLTELGVTVHMDGGAEEGGNAGRVLGLNAGNIRSTIAPYDLVRKMRASVLVLGPLLARFGEAKVSLPGGCAIGTRPVDLHLKGLEAMGADLQLVDGYIIAKAPKGGLQGAEINFPIVSVGATENLLMAASLAKGTTILNNAAREPEVTDLAHCLIAMGADIEGLGTERLVIHGKDSLHGADYAVLPDRIEAGSYMAAAAITNGDVELIGAQRQSMGAVITAFNDAGVLIEDTDRGLRVRRENGLMHGVDVTTLPYPGFPTDMQAQFMAMMTLAEGASNITETVFENRFMHVPELGRMGANISVHGSTALVRGVKSLRGAPVMATDLRASMSLVIAGLAAEGQTVVNRLYHLDRGYERLEEKLAACGARIKREREV